MGKRYFCDYCQRSFIDDIDSRKKHLNGVAHLRLKKEYFALNRDLRTLIEEERRKEFCRRFIHTGDCPFGLNCHHTHYTEQELSSFERIVEEKDRELNGSTTIDGWLKSRLQQRELTVPIRISDVAEVKSSVFDSYAFSTSTDLPHSLRPPTFEDIDAATLNDWG